MAIVFCRWKGSTGEKTRRPNDHVLLTPDQWILVGTAVLSSATSIVTTLINRRKPPPPPPGGGDAVGTDVTD